jgi:uncharacterized protein YcaQ
MDALPAYRVVMRRAVTFADWCRNVLAEHGQAIDEMRQVLAERPEVSNRDFAMGERQRVDSYRGRKDSSVALHYLWRVGDAMVARRTPTFERVYARPDRVAPPRFLRAADDATADEYLLLESVRNDGLSKVTGANWIPYRDIDRDELQGWRDRMIGDGHLVEVQVEGLIGPHLVQASELEHLHTLAGGRVPRAWRPIGPSTTDEVTLLSPLDPVIHNRLRTRRLFGFDYKWGVYDKVERRAFGYYDLPILWGDQLVGRTDLRYDRSAGRLVTLGRWFEPGLDRTPAFDAALAAGLARLEVALVPHGRPQGSRGASRDLDYDREAGPGSVTTPSVLGHRPHVADRPGEIGERERPSANPPLHNVVGEPPGLDGRVAVAEARGFGQVAGEDR